MKVLAFIVIMIMVAAIASLEYLRGFQDGIDAAAKVIDDEIKKREKELEEQDNG